MIKMSNMKKRMMEMKLMMIIWMVYLNSANIVTKLDIVNYNVLIFSHWIYVGKQTTLHKGVGSDQRLRLKKKSKFWMVKYVASYFGSHVIIKALSMDSYIVTWMLDQLGFFCRWTWIFWFRIWLFKAWTRPTLSIIFSWKSSL